MEVSIRLDSPSIPLHNSGQSAALPPRHRLRVSRGDDHVTVSRSIDLSVAGAVGQLETGFAYGSAEAM